MDEATIYRESSIANSQAGPIHRYFTPPEGIENDPMVEQQQLS